MPSRPKVKRRTAERYIGKLLPTTDYGRCISQKGVEPNKVEDFIKYLKNDHQQKDVLIDGFYGIYGQAAHFPKGNESSKLQVENKEWKKLAQLLESSATINSHMRKFTDFQKQKETLY